MDETEGIRRVMVPVINAVLSPEKQERYDQLRREYAEDDIFTTDTVGQYFTIDGFMAPFVVVTRKSDRQRGSLMFCDSPRFYFGFEAYKPS